MKTKEFIEKVEELGFDVEVVCYKKNDSIEIERKIYIRNKENQCMVASLWVERVYEFDNNWACFTKLPEETKKQLFDLLVEYSSTSIKKREEEKKYYLKHKLFKNGGDSAYLNCKTESKNYVLDSNIETEKYKTKFTEQEIEEIKQKFNTSLDDFEIIEVEWYIFNRKEAKYECSNYDR